ncbi:hypothetical protein [Herpetosiphon sp. NSE202]|uniref:hypothetical protein n=1 Tax=Herpetosiphon sp. NSE202 TaxID=3351349 RepID=UPI00363D7898
MPARKPIIRASELGEYDFCARAWWLRRECGWQGRFPERLAQGEVAHQRHGRDLQQSQWLRTVAIGLLLLAALALVFA